MVDVALKMLMDDRPRFLITVSGVGLSVTLVLVQIGLYFGMLDNASVTIARSGADLWVTARNAPNVDFGNTYPESYVRRVRSVPGVARADNLIVWYVTVALPNGSKESTLLYALDDFSRWSLPWSVAEGDPRDLRRGAYVMLDESASRRFGPFALGEYREFLGRRLKIIGRSRGARSFTTNPIVFMDQRVAQSLLPQELRRRTTYTLVKLDPGADTPAIAEEIRRRLPYNDVWTTEAWAARSRRYWVESTGLGLSMTVTIFLGALVGVVIVAQTLYASTMDHHAEFAVIKALGGGNGDIYRILAEQAAIAAMLGFLGGWAMAYAARPMLARADLALVLEPEFAATVFVATLGLCLAASAISFRKVASIDPALAFRG
jgi:putative ABC transport system permease protein